MLKPMIDLHTHSTYSDGTLSPAELIHLARERGISTVALTDHDTVAGVEEAQKAADALGLRFVPGIELSVRVDRGEFHLLGLGLTKGLAELEERLQEIRNFRNRRNLLMVEKMRQAGIEVSYEDIRGHAEGDVVGRPHFAAFLVERGECRDPKEAFQRYLGTGRPFYVAKEVMTLEEAVGQVIQSGGIPIVAHPLSLQLKWGPLEEAIPRWKELGIRGMETMHPSATRARTHRLEEMARRNGLLAVAGSDYHGSNLPNRKLGRTGWGTKIPPAYDDVIEYLMEESI